MTSQHRIHPRITQRIAFALLWLAGLVVFLPVVGIIGLMVARGSGGLTVASLTSVEEDLLPATVGTISLVFVTALISAPLGVAAAVYLSEYARRGPAVNAIRLALVNLAGVPSVVYGLFGLALFVMVMHFGRSLLAGSCTLALLSLPLVISASEEALRQVPLNFRDASLALGATRWQTVWRIVLPNAMPGIITSLILALSRAAGETAPILFTAAFFSLTDPFPNNLLDEVLALPYQLYVICTEVPGIAEETKWATALLLVTVTLGLNGVATVARAWLRRRQAWR